MRDWIAWLVREVLLEFRTIYEGGYSIQDPRGCCQENHAGCRTVVYACHQRFRIANVYFEIVGTRYHLLSYQLIDDLIKIRGLKPRCVALVTKSREMNPSQEY